MLYIVKNNYFLSGYILDAIKNKEGVSIIQYERIKPKGGKKVLHLVKRFIRAFICNRQGLWIDDFFSHSFLSALKDITPNDNVLFWGCENLKELLMLNKEISCRVKNVFLWNPVSTINRTIYSKWEYTHYLHRSGMQVFTFDGGDALRYGFHSINQVYRNPNFDMHETSDLSQVDVFYIGVDKHRTSILECLKEEFDKEDISYNIYIKKDKHSVVSPKLTSCYVDKLIPYEETLAMVSRSKCILEILQKRQAGMTLRTLEAVFLNKKLITNSKDIVNTPIYSPNNIYVIGNDEPRSIKEFLETPMTPLPSSIVRNYNIEHWIEQFH